MLEQTRTLMEIVDHRIKTTLFKMTYHGVYSLHLVIYLMVVTLSIFLIPHPKKLQNTFFFFDTKAAN